MTLVEIHGAGQTELKFYDETVGGMRFGLFAFGGERRGDTEED